MMKRMLSIAVALCGALVASAEQLSVKTPVLVSGGSAAVEISLDNEHADLVAFQMDLTLPEGVGIERSSSVLSSRIMDGEQVLTIGRLSGNTYRLTSASFSLTPISGASGTLLTLKLTSTADFVNGEASISNILFSTASSQAVVAPDISFAIKTLYTITYVLDGEIYTTDTLEYGAEIVPPVIPGLEEYTIWEDVPETMPASDITVYGKAKEIIDSLNEVKSEKYDNAVYDLSGGRVNSSFFTLHSSFKKRGINIIRYSDGTTRKVIIK